MLTTESVCLHSARPADVRLLEAFIGAYTRDGSLLPRSRADLLRRLGDFRLAWAGRRLVGCGALQRVDANLAEVRSVAVDPAWRHRGIGRQIVRALLDDAAGRGVASVFCLTRRLEFFTHLGFEVVPRERFPHKVWDDCRLCPRLLLCDETAMQRAVLP